MIAAYLTHNNMSLHFHYTRIAQDKDFCECYFQRPRTLKVTLWHVNTEKHCHTVSSTILLKISDGMYCALRRIRAPTATVQQQVRPGHLSHTVAVLSISNTTQAPHCSLTQRPQTPNWSGSRIYATAVLLVLYRKYRSTAGATYTCTVTSWIAKNIWWWL